MHVVRVCILYDLTKIVINEKIFSLMRFEIRSDNLDYAERKVHDRSQNSTDDPKNVSVPIKRVVIFQQLPAKP